MVGISQLVYEHANSAPLLGSTRTRNLNPVPYEAEYTGHKLHMNQNEKLVMFGVTHVLAVDGFSKKVVGLATMPVKTT